MIEIGPNLAETLQYLIALGVTGFVVYIFFKWTN